MDSLILLRGVTTTPVSLRFSDRTPISIDDCIRLFDTLFAFRDTTQWWIGDLLNETEKTFGETYAQLASSHNVSPEYLRNVAWVCAAIPPSMRHPELSFSHHAAVAPARFSDADRTTLLNMAKEESLTVAELRTRIKSLYPTINGALEQGDGESIQGPPVNARGNGDNSSGIDLSPVAVDRSGDFIINQNGNGDQGQFPDFGNTDLPDDFDEKTDTLILYLPHPISAMGKSVNNQLKFVGPEYDKGPRYYYNLYRTQKIGYAPGWQPVLTTAANPLEQGGISRNYRNLSPAIMIYDQAQFASKRDFAAAIDMDKPDGMEARLYTTEMTRGDFRYLYGQLTAALKAHYRRTLNLPREYRVDGNTRKRRSHLERHFALLWRLFGLPGIRLMPQMPLVLRNFMTFRESKYLIDFALPEIGLCIEIQGGTYMRGRSGHTSGKGYARDRIKSSSLLSKGYTMVEFTQEMIRDNPIGTIARLVDVIEMRLRVLAGGRYKAPYLLTAIPDNHFLTGSIGRPAQVLFNSLAGLSDPNPIVDDSLNRLLFEELSDRMA